MDNQPVPIPKPPRLIINKTLIRIDDTTTTTTTPPRGGEMARIYIPVLITGNFKVESEEKEEDDRVFDLQLLKVKKRLYYKNS